WDVDVASTSQSVWAFPVSGAGNDRDYYGVIRITGLQGTGSGTRKVLDISMVSHNALGNRTPQSHYGGGLLPSNAAINGVRFSLTGGSFDQGVITIMQR